MDSIEGLLTYCRENHRVCPMATKWNDLTTLLGDFGPLTKTKVPAPLILAAWPFTSNSEKRTRLREQIEWAKANGMILLVKSFLGGLKESEWLRDEH